MHARLCQLAYRHDSRYFGIAPPLVLLLAMLFAVGCGGGTKTTFSGNTAVVILASSTANDQLFQFSVTLESLKLTSQSGETVSLLTNPVGDEFIHLNGRAEPLATVSVPQGIYTSVAATVSGAYPACAGQQSSGGYLIDGALGGVNGSTPAAVQMVQPITVTGSVMGLILDLQVSKSAPFSGGCSQSLTNAVTVTPTFSLTPISIAAQPTNNANGKLLSVMGVIDTPSANGSGFTVNAFFGANQGPGPKWQVSLNGSTTFQGVASAEGLTTGMPVDMDLVIEPDGSLLATRVAVYDTDTANLSAGFGPLVAKYDSAAYQAIYPMMDVLVVEQMGGISQGYDAFDNLNQSTTHISGQFKNLPSLPFAASFNTANMVNGQNIFYSTHQPLSPLSPPSTMASATAITLLPQTIDGKVSTISSEGDFTTYTVTLASYDLFPNLAVVPGQTTLLKNPNTVEVYTDHNTQMLNTQPIAVGSVVRFNGLVFNDAGTLRMDCAQINDGVPE